MTNEQFTELVTSIENDVDLSNLKFEAKLRLVKFISHAQALRLQANKAAAALNSVLNPV